MEIPEKIDITIPAQEYSSAKYTNRKGCYIYDALKEKGFEDIEVFLFGSVMLNGLFYFPEKSFTSTILRNSFSLGQSVHITLSRK